MYAMFHFAYWTTIFLASIFSSVTFALPQRNQAPSSYYPITGLPASGGIPGVRLELRQFQTDRTRLNLYLVAMSRFQSFDQSDRLSYYQVSGIHGAPYGPWDNVFGSQSNSGSGYCEHASVLFPTWHRPYLALFEQILWGIVQEFVQEFPQGSEARSRHETAAMNWRMPYWDWAQDASMPSIVGEQRTVQVELPTGFTTIRNPLYSYVFHPLISDDFPFAPFSRLRETVRAPNAQGQSQPLVVNRQLRSNQNSLRDRVFNLLTLNGNYQIFSNKAWNQGNAGGQESIESLHDSIHGWVGNGGHMSYIDVSAMDPIFWLHHTNVDRLVALWQATFPGSFTTDQYTPWGTFFIPQGTTEGIDTPLAPFHRADSSFWTSSASRSLRTFGYTYPELADTSNMSETQLRSTIRSRVNRLYGQRAALNILRPFDGFAPVSGFFNSKRSLEGGSSAPSDNDTTPQFLDKLIREGKLTTNGLYNEWIVSIRCKMQAVDGSFFVHVFLGEPPKDPAEWGFDKNLIGTHTVFSHVPIASTMTKCHPNSDMNKIISASIPLTSALLDKIEAGELKSLKPEDCIKYLQSNLQWRVQSVNGTVINAKSISSLKLGVSSTEVCIPKHPDDVPAVGQWKSFYDVAPPPAIC